MPIFIQVESKSVKGRIFHGVTFLLLTLGGATMIYPFLLMVSGSFRSEMDQNDMTLMPAYFVSDDVLYQKFVETKYNQNLETFNSAHLSRDFAFWLVEAPNPPSRAAAQDLEAFIQEANLPNHWQILGGIQGTLTVPENLRQLRKNLARTFDGNPEAFAREMGTAITSWQEVFISVPRWMEPTYNFLDNSLNSAYVALLEESPMAERQLVSLSGHFLNMVIFPRYNSLENMNALIGESLVSFNQFRLPSQVPGEDNPLYRSEWIDFVLQDLNVSFVLVDGISNSEFGTFLSELYEGNLSELNAVWETNFRDFSEIELPAGEFMNGGVRNDYVAFLQAIGPEHWRLIGPEYSWETWLAQRYGSVEALSEAYGIPYLSFRQVWLPMGDLEMVYTLENKWSLRAIYAARNFINVFDAIFVEGRVFRNTVIYCVISVLAAVLINPLAAYALSRFQLPGTYKILLLMMAVMAFPPMVTTIPVFIMLQNMNLMNTFAALILPSIASGYLIYLLKGFFDSLPRELYEAAQIDGASEFRMFFNITMALSKPILAVVALSAFNSAYTAFLFALIVAPDQDMWLLSVWLYQYRLTVSSGGVFASVLIASVPPIVVFIFAQNIILRGIVVPVEK